MRRVRYGHTGGPLFQGEVPVVRKVTGLSFSHGHADPSPTPAPATLASGGRPLAYGSGGGAIQAYDLPVGATTVAEFPMRRIARERPELYERWRREL